MKLVFVIWCLVTFNNLNVGAVLTPIVKTTTGLVRGKLNYYNGFKYFSFHGIPYAESPTGLLRFQPPVPKKPWTHVLDASEEGVVCPQWDLRYKFEQMSEDCLRVNVYVPEGGRELPVLVFVHGGGFSVLSGSSDYLYGPQFFLQRGIIVVTLNYRLGPLGFLSLGINEASGNAGIKDVILALKWINQNIQRFGGNNNKITIGGHSSGAALANFLLLTKKADKLFHQVILISGSALHYRFLSRHPRDEALALAEKLGIKSNDSHIILKKLQQTDVFEIVQASRILDRMTNKHVLKPCNYFRACVEQNYSHAVITENPTHIMKTIGLIQNVPILTGINAREGLYMLPRILNWPEATNKLHDNVELCIPPDIEYPEGSPQSRKLGNSINEMYFRSDNSDNFCLDRLLDLASDCRYIYSSYAWIKLHKSNLNSSKLFFYNFNFDGDLNWSKLNYDIEYPGTAHADELGYIFVTNRTVNRIENANNESKHMIYITVNIFSNFIKFGTPQPNSGTKWPEFNMKDQQYMEICPNLAVKSLLNSDMFKRLHFWENVYHQYQKYVQYGGKLENKCRIHFN
ncbi:juvenile hormone esterase-like [Epargyreus clarus]|uniref:juvenile hormone esterase-like n=1 Tax=Epargyreus clarus TaxID=520877 RepID=UPI003C2EDDF5